MQHLARGITHGENEVKLRGEVRKGQLVIEPVGLAIACRDLDGRRVTVEIEAEKAIRTIRANKRYWKVLIPLGIDYFSKTRDVPLSKYQVHFIFASAFLGVIQTELGVLVPMETHTLDTHEFYDFTENVTAFLTQKGYTIPEYGPREMSAA